MLGQPQFKSHPVEIDSARFYCDAVPKSLLRHQGGVYWMPSGSSADQQQHRDQRPKLKQVSPISASDLESVDAELQQMDAACVRMDRRMSAFVSDLRAAATIYASQQATINARMDSIVQKLNEK